LKIGVYLGDIKKHNSVGDLTFELSFVNELLSHKSDHNFVFYYFGEKNVFEEKDNAEFVNLKYYKKPEITLSPFCVKFYKTPIKSLNYRLKKDNINLMFFLTPYLHEHIELPYFTVIRDVSHRILPHFPEFSTNSVLEKMEKKLNIFLTGASKIIVSNNIAKSDIKTLYDVIEENIFVIPLPCPSWVTKAKPREEILKKNNLAKKSYILYPAQFWAHKNHIRLVMTAQNIHEHNMNLKVVFTGQDRGNAEYLKKQVEELDLKEDVLFLDFVSQDELGTLYKNAFAVVYPSLAGIDSLVALEAMYFKCPLLISNHLGYKEQLKNSALYFNPLDERDIFNQIGLLDDTVIKDELIANGTNLINSNTSKNYIDRILNMVDSFYLTRQCWSLEESYKNK